MATATEYRSAFLDQLDPAVREAALNAAHMAYAIELTDPPYLAVYQNAVTAYNNCSPQILHNVLNHIKQLVAEWKADQETVAQETVSLRIREVVLLQQDVERAKVITASIYQVVQKALTDLSSYHPDKLDGSVRRREGLDMTNLEIRCAEVVGARMTLNTLSQQLTDLQNALLPEFGILKGILQTPAYKYAGQVMEAYSTSSTVDRLAVELLKTEPNLCKEIREIRNHLVPLQ